MCNTKYIYPNITFVFIVVPVPRTTNASGLVYNSYQELDPWAALLAILQCLGLHKNGWQKPGYGSKAGCCDTL